MRALGRPRRFEGRAVPSVTPIRVHEWPLEETRSPAKGCASVAACESAGVPYSAKSRHGASNELARALVAAGISDAPMIVTHRGLRGEAMIRSFHEAARW